MKAHSTTSRENRLSDRSEASKHTSLNCEQFSSPTKNIVSCNPGSSSLVGQPFDAYPHTRESAGFFHVASRIFCVVMGNSFKYEI